MPIKHATDMQPERSAAERAGMVVVVEQSRVAAPVDHAPQRLVRAARIEMIVEFELETLARRAMPFAFAQHFVDMLGERHEPDDMLAKQTPPGIVVALREYMARGT